MIKQSVRILVLLPEVAEHVSPKENSEVSKVRQLPYSESDRRLQTYVLPSITDNDHNTRLFPFHIDQAPCPEKGEACKAKRTKHVLPSLGSRHVVGL